MYTVFYKFTGRWLAMMHIVVFYTVQRSLLPMLNSL